MKRTMLLVLTATFAGALCARADVAEDALEKRIEKKVVSEHKADVAKKNQSTKAKLDVKADNHANSSKSTGGHASDKPTKVPPKKPPPPNKKPAPPTHH
jgi:hypothetical protein